jgi:hypothetical protein
MNPPLGPHITHVLAFCQDIRSYMKTCAPMQACTCHSIPKFMAREWTRLCKRIMVKWHHMEMDQYSYLSWKWFAIGYHWPWCLHHQGWTWKLLLHVSNIVEEAQSQNPHLATPCTCKYKRPKWQYRKENHPWLKIQNLKFMHRHETHMYGLGKYFM